MPNIKPKYEELASKYSLPEYEKLDGNFSIHTIENENQLLRQIISKIEDRIEFLLNTINEILHPDTGNLHIMHECQQFDEQEKKELYNLYKKLMYFSRNSVEVLMHNDRSMEAEFIVNFSNHWESIKPNFIEFFKKLKNSWNLEEEIEENLGYLG